MYINAQRILAIIVTTGKIGLESDSTTFAKDVNPLKFLLKRLETIVG